MLYDDIFIAIRIESRHLQEISQIIHIFAQRTLRSRENDAPRCMDRGASFSRDHDTVWVITICRLTKYRRKYPASSMRQFPKI